MPNFRAQNNTTYSSTGESDVVTKPTGTVDNDIVLLFLSLYEDGAAVLNAEKTITWPAGFTELHSLYNGELGGQETQLACAWKLAATEGTDYTISWTGSAGNKSVAATYRGGYTAAPIDDSSENNESGNSASQSIPAVTAGAPDTLHVGMAINWDGNAFALTDTGGMTERIATGSMRLLDEAIAAQGAVSANTITFNSVGMDGRIDVSVLIQAQPENADIEFTAFRGSGNESFDDTTFALSPTVNIPAGALVVVVAASDNTSSTDGETTEHTITDTDGHTWNKMREQCESAGGANAGVTVSLWWAVTTAIIATTDSITLTLSSTHFEKTLMIYEFAVNAAGTVTEGGDNGTSAGFVSTYSLTTTGLASQNYTWLSATGRESTSTTTTQPNTYNPRTNTEISAGISAHFSYRYVLTDTAETFAPSFGTTRDTAAILGALYVAAAAGGATNPGWTSNRGGWS